jgi:hypothetical protein
MILLYEVLHRILKESRNLVPSSLHGVRSIALGCSSPVPTHRTTFATQAALHFAQGRKFCRADNRGDCSTYLGPRWCDTGARTQPSLIYRFAGWPVAQVNKTNPASPPTSPLEAVFTCSRGTPAATLSGNLLSASDSSRNAATAEWS